MAEPMLTLAPHGGARRRPPMPAGAHASRDAAPVRGGEIGRDGRSGTLFRRTAR